MPVRIHLCFGAVIVLTCATALAAPTTAPVTLSKPLYVEVYVRTTTSRPNEDVAGNLIKYDDNGPTIQTSAGPRTLVWTDLTPTSAFVCRSRVIDKTSATDWLELGRFGWSINAQDQAIGALDRAVTLDHTLRDQADSIRHSPPGSALATAKHTTPADANGPFAAAPTAGTTSSDHPGDELIRPTTQPAISSHPMGSASQTRIAPGDLIKFQKSTPEQDAAAIDAAKENAAKVSDELHIKFATLDTPHFIIFTDWDPREYDFLKQCVESAYAAVSTQFDYPVNQNVFVGRLPVYMFDHYNDFATFTRKLGLNITVSQNLRGYYSGHYSRTIKDTIGEMVMWKPPTTGGAAALNLAKIQWAHTLEHEFTHAFIARYLTNESIPRWLNEGIAELISSKDFANGGTSRDWARLLAANGVDLSSLFDDDKMPTGETYPVMMEMVELLTRRNHGAFLQYFDAIKYGANPEQALRQYYGMDYPALLKAWHDYALTIP